MILSEQLKEKIKGLPDTPGVYIMRDKSGAIIYIGKAVVLKNRVRQYFNNSPKQVKVQAMVDHIADFEYMIALTEKDALTLEANLIKKHKPKYNILLKDDKSSPYIKIDMRQEFPAIEVTRHVKRDGAKYFGPYFNGIYVWDIVSIIRSAYRMRTCPKNLRKNGRECLNYHIGLCCAPCCGHISRGEYLEIVNKVVAFLSGREDSAQRLITQKMEESAKNEDFERAITYRKQLEMLKKLSERTVANLGPVLSLDLFAYVSDGEQSAISIALVRGGKMMGVKNFSMCDASLSAEDALSGFITQYYNAGGEVPSEICLPGEQYDVAAVGGFLNNLCGRKVEISFPKIGAKRKLMEMARRNAEDYLVKSVDKLKRSRDMTVGACDRLAGILGLERLRRMECYDISNISGVDKVSSQVVFIDGAPEKSEYRKYKIKTVEGSNDFASMAETLRRRFARAQDGDEKFSEMPDLIVVDGGKGQLSAAHEVLEQMGVSVPLVGLAKREEEIFTVGSSEPILLSKSDNALKLMQRIRDEAHRFAITYHRNLRSNRYVSQLLQIPGVGEKKCKLLLAAFPNFQMLTQADAGTLAAVHGIDARTAQSVADYFAEKRKDN